MGTQIKKVIDQFDPFLQFWTTASSWKVRRLLVKGWARQGLCRGWDGRDHQGVAKAGIMKGEAGRDCQREGRGWNTHMASAC